MMKIDQDQLEHLFSRYALADMTQKQAEKMRKRVPSLFTTEAKLMVVSNRMGMKVTLK